MNPRAALRILPVFAVVAFGASLLAQAPAPAAVYGVVRLSTGEPAGNAIVNLKRSNGHLYSTQTSSDGTFAIEDAAPGDYRISASRDGDLPAMYGVIGSGSCGLPLALQSGRRMENIALEMAPAGVITGRIRGPDGQPAIKIPVQAMKVVYQSNRRTLQTIKSTTTDDRGEYRLFGLTPGSYLVAAREPTITITYAGTEDQQRVAYCIAASRKATQGGVLGLACDLPPGEVTPRIPPAYFPGVDSPSTATVVELKPGDTFGGVDIRIGKPVARTIRGTVRGVLPESMQSVALSLESREPGLGGAQVKLNADGTFTLTSVRPGRYLLYAKVSGANALSSITDVDVAAADLDGIDVTLSKGIEVSGHLQMDNPDALARIIGVSLSPIGDTPSAIGNLTAPVSNGVFRIQGIPPGEYQAMVTYRSPLDVYVKSMRLGTDDVRNGFRLDATPAEPLEIVAGNNGGVVDGVALTRSGQLAAGAAVILVPDASFRKRMWAFKTATADATGAFHFDVIAPGSYRILALDAVEAGAWQSPDFLSRYESEGQPLTIDEGSTRKIQIVMTPGEPLYGSCDADSMFPPPTR